MLEPHVHLVLGSFEQRLVSKNVAVGLLDALGPGLILELLQALDLERLILLLEVDQQVIPCEYVKFRGADLDDLLSVRFSDLTIFFNDLLRKIVDGDSMLQPYCVHERFPGFSSFIYFLNLES